MLKLILTIPGQKKIEKNARDVAEFKRLVYLYVPGNATEKEDKFKELLKSATEKKDVAQTDNNPGGLG